MNFITLDDLRFFGLFIYNNPIECMIFFLIGWIFGRFLHRDKMDTICNQIYDLRNNLTNNLEIETKDCIIKESNYSTPILKVKDSTEVINILCPCCDNKTKICSKNGFKPCIYATNYKFTWKDELKSLAKRILRKISFG